MSIGHPIPELWLIQYLTLKIKGQGHEWGHSSKSLCGSSILLTHIPFVPCQSALPFLGYSIFKVWSWKWMGQGHGWGHSLKSKRRSNILSTLILFVPCQSGIPFLSYDFFKVWPWKSKLKVMGEVDIENHNVGLAYYQLISFSFHVNWPSHSWDTAFSKFDLENQGSRSNDPNVAQLQV